MAEITCEGKYFNPFDLDGYSMEYEVTHNPNCIPNKVKLGLFLAWLIIFIIILAYLVSLLIRDRFFINKKYVASQRIILFCIVAALAEVILFAIFLSGMDTMGRYILFPLTSVPPLLGCIISVHDWFRASGEIQLKVKKGITIEFFLFGIILTAGFVICWTIGPMVFFTNPHILNWFFVFGYFFNGIISPLAGLLLLRSINSLVSAAQPAMEMGESSDVVEYLTKLKESRKSIGIGGSGYILLALVPIWMVTQTETNPGLANFFYFEFCFAVILRAFGLLSIGFVTEKNFRSVGKNKSQQGSQRSDPRKSDLSSKDKAPISYTVEELNAH